MMKFRDSLLIKFYKYLIPPIILIILILGFGVYFLVRSYIIEFEKTNSLQLTANQAIDIRKELESAKKHINNLAENYNSSNTEQKNNLPEIFRLSNIKNDFEFISFFDKNGQIIFSTSAVSSNSAESNFSYRKYVKEALAGQSGFETAIGRSTGILGIFFSQPVYENNELVGGIVGKINIYSFENNISEDFRKNFENIYLLDEFGIILVSTNIDNRLKSLTSLNTSLVDQLKYDLRRYPNLKESSLEEEAIFAQINNYNQPVSMIARKNNTEKINQIVKVGEFPLYLVSQKDTSYLNSVIFSATTRIAIMLITSLFCLFGFIFIILALVLKPISKFKNAFIEIQKGNYAHKIELIEKNELGILAQMFNEMTDKIAQNQDQQNEIIMSKTKKLEEQTNALVNVLEDVENQKNNAINNLRELKKFQLAAENSSDIITITDKEGIVVYVNKAVESMTGFTISETMGRKAGVLWGKLMDKSFYEELWNTIKVEKKEYRARINNHKKNGEKFIAEISITPLLDEKNDILFFVSVQRDVDQEVQLEKLKNEFISLASHQLRTPLAAIKWYIEILNTQGFENLNEEQKDVFKQIELSNQRMINLVNALLNISRIESGRMIIKPEVTDLKNLVEDVIVELKENTKSKSININFEFEKELQSVSIDPKLIREVYKNLLTNAIKYSKENTNINIHVYKKDDFIESEVTDQGYGIPLDDQNKIFGKFYRAKNVIKLDVEGNGLGLYLTKAIVEASGGKIWFKSKESVGTTFYFTLPLAGSEENQGQVSIDPEPIK